MPKTSPPKDISKIVTVRKWLMVGPRRWVLLGLLGVVIAFACSAGLYALALPAKGTADSPLHLDYAWQLFHGDLPSFWEGTQLPVAGIGSRVQFVSQHPPLYYMLIAPVVGPLVDSGHWQLGVGLARIITIGIGMACIAAFSWAGWVIGGKRKYVFAVAVPAIAVSLTPFIKISGDVMNDSLVVCASTVALTIATMLLKNGPSPKLIAGLSVTAAIGMASRATFISALLVSLAALGIATLVHAKGPFWQKVLRGAGYCAIVVLTVVIATGWFYYRNYQASGDWYRSGPQSWAAEALNRPYKSFKQVVLGKEVWLLVPEQLFGRPWSGWGNIGGKAINSVLSLVIFIGAVCGALLWLWQKYRRKRSIDWPQVLVIGMLGLYSLLVVAQQLRHATGYGAINVRYLLPLWLPLALVLTLGALAWKKLRGQGVTVLVTIGYISSVLNTIWYVGQNRASASYWQHFIAAISKKGGSTVIVILVFIVIMLAIIAQAVALWNLTRSDVEKT